MTKSASYHRPKSVLEALQLLNKLSPATIIAGGTHIVPALGQPAALIDLQAAGLTAISVGNDRLTLGAMTTLQTLADLPEVPAALRDLAHREAPNTIRHAATLGGLLVTADWQSQLLAGLLAADAHVEMATSQGSQTMPLADFLADVPTALQDGLVSAVSLARNSLFRAEHVARTPADRPIVAVVACRNAAGDIRLALSGVAATPILSTPETVAALTPPADFRGSSPYRRDMAVALSRRALANLAHANDNPAAAAPKPTTTNRVPVEVTGDNRTTLTINGAKKIFAVETATETLLRLLRREGYYSVRFGSDDGATGAAAILVDGKLVNSDTMLALQADGHAIETAEGLASGTDLSVLQQAFVRVGAIQSGYSTPAMLLAAIALLRAEPNPSEAQIRDAFSGILDRETGYLKPVQAVQQAAAILRGETPPDASPKVVPPLLPESEAFQVIGKAEDKVDALKLVKGNPAFVDDFEMRGMLHAKVLYSPHAHARIVSIDDNAARALPGVNAVIHYKNIKRVRYASGGQSYPNPKPYDQVSFDNKVRYVGDRVAAVAAETVEIAAAALKLIKVEYEILPAVFDENEAIKPGAPVIHDEPDMAGAHDAAHNISHHIEAEVGSVEQGFAAADHVFEHQYYVHQVQQTPIEPHIAISYWDSDERLVLRTSTQVPFHVRRMVAPLLDLPVKRIRVIKPRIGGGFGVKQEMLLEDIVGHLTIATGRPVRLELTRDEEFRSSRTRHPQTITFKSGVNADGTLVAQEYRCVANTGPYATHGLTVQTVSGLRGLSTYNSEHKRFDCKVAYTNIPVPGAYRGYGAPQAHFALESHMEEIAEALGMDAIAFKRKNWVNPGDPIPIAPHLGEGEADNVTNVPLIISNGLAECVSEGMAAIDWNRRNAPNWQQVPGQPHLRRGMGMAVCMQGSGIPGLDMGGASLKINDDGSFNLLVGATDLGTGSDTVLGQIAAEVLGVPLEDIIVYSSDTDMTPFDTGAYASSTTYISGTAVKHAAEKLKQQIQERAQLMLGLDDWQGVALQNRHAVAPDGRQVSLEALALHSLHQDQQTQLMASASYVSYDSPPPFAAQFMEVLVDVETGQVTVEKMVLAVDSGIAINPVTASGQIEGGMLQALGYGHCEEMVYDDAGNLLNPEFGPYKIYRADEMPEMEAILVQTFEPTGPFGAKAVAEIPKDGAAPALANAVYNATGVRIREIPFTPERVLNALADNN